MQTSSIINEHETNSSSEVSVVERRDELWSAYNKYIQEGIPLEELEQIEARYTPSLFKESKQPTSLNSSKNA